MNIFRVHNDPVIAAQSLVDRHVVKMILESAQLLSTAHRLLDGEEYVGQSKTGRKAKRWRLNDERESIIYSATHINHPSSIWCRTSVQNYLWLVEHMFGLLQEYTHRYSKVHSIQKSKLSYLLQSPPHNLKDFEETPFLCAMAEEYIISDDPVINYRNYYIQGKKHLHRWSNRSAPDWMNVG
jgi:hypothetical protein